MKSSSRKRLGFGLVVLFGVGLVFMQNRHSSPPALTIADLVEDMVSIPAGTFVMGSPDDELDRAKNEGPQTTVTISKPFWMSKYEVTQGQYEEEMGNNPTTTVPKATAQLELAELYQKTRPEEAVDLYQQIAADYPGTLVGEVATQRLEELAD